MSRRESDRGDSRRSEWEAYADYESVSERVAESVGDAVEALEMIESARRSSDKLEPEFETSLRADVMAATIWVRTELENGREQHDLYDEILTRWDGDGEEAGFIERFRNANLVAQQPAPWLTQFAEDIHRAGWELGYLKAGREKQIGESGDGHDGELRDMIEGMGE